MPALILAHENCIFHLHWQDCAAGVLTIIALVAIGLFQLWHKDCK